MKKYSKPKLTKEGNAFQGRSSLELKHFRMMIYGKYGWIEQENERVIRWANWR